MFHAHTHLTPFLTHDCRLSATNPQWHLAWEKLDLETPFVIQVNSLVLCAHPTPFFLELGASSMGCYLSTPTSSSRVHEQTTLRWGRAHVCISHYNIFPGPFADPPPACFHFTSGAKTRAKMEFHFQMRFHKTFYQICRLITLAGFSLVCSRVILSFIPLSSRNG